MGIYVHVYSYKYSAVLLHDTVFCFVSWRILEKILHKTIRNNFSK